MPITTPITFVVAVNNEHVLRSNFLASPCFAGLHPHQIFKQTGFRSAARAYNDALDRSVNDLIIFCHQDVYLPENWLQDLQKALVVLEQKDRSWGVLGPGGIDSKGNGRGHLYSSGLGVLGERFEHPVPIETLDEIVLVLRKSSGLRFDEGLPHFHLYATDICLQAAQRGMVCYAISAFCIHNTVQNSALPEEYYACCKYIRRVWKDRLPIQTTCMVITKFGLPIYYRRVREAYLKYVRRRHDVVVARSADVRHILEQIPGRA